MRFHQSFAEHMLLIKCAARNLLKQTGAFVNYRYLCSMQPCNSLKAALRVKNARAAYNFRCFVLNDALKLSSPVVDVSRVQCEMRATSTTSVPW